MADALHTLSAAELGRRLAAGTLTSRALCEALLARYQAVNDKVGAFTHLDQADVLAQADASDARLLARAGRRRPLALAALAPGPPATSLARGAGAARGQLPGRGRRRARKQQWLLLLLVALQQLDLNNLVDLVDMQLHPDKLQQLLVLMVFVQK